MPDKSVERVLLLLSDISEQVEQVVSLFYNNGCEGDGFTTLPTIWEPLSEVLTLLTEGQHCTEQISYVMAVIPLLETALVNRDMIKICDLLYFELIPQLQSVYEELP